MKVRLDLLTLAAATLSLGICVFVDCMQEYRTVEYEGPGTTDWSAVAYGGLAGGVALALVLASLAIKRT